VRASSWFGMLREVKAFKDEERGRRDMHSYIKACVNLNKGHVCYLSIIC